MSSEQHYEDVLVTQMHSLWFDEPTPALQPRKRKSIYASIAEPIKPQRESHRGLKSDSGKKKQKWLNRFNNVLNTYNKPVTFGGNRETSEKRELVISTPFDFNHLGHISDNDTFGVDKLFNLPQKESHLLGSILHEHVSPLVSSGEEIEERDSYVAELPAEESRRQTRGVSLFTTAPIENPKVMKRSISDKSVNSSLLFSRSSSINTLATSASTAQHQQHKPSLSGHSLKSLMELEKYHQRTLSGGANKPLPKKPVSPHSSYINNSKSSSVVEDIIEDVEEEEGEAHEVEGMMVPSGRSRLDEDEEALDMPSLVEEEMNANYSFPAFAPTAAFQTPVVEPPHDALSWNESPMSFMRSSWIYKDESPLQRAPAFISSPLHGNDLDRDDEDVSPTRAMYQMCEENSSAEEMMAATFRAGTYSRRSRLSLHAHPRGSVLFADNTSVDGSILLPQAGTGSTSTTASN